MTDQYTEISFNAGETLRASQLNTVVQNINIINDTKADKPAGNESYATVSYVDNSIAGIPATDLSNYYTKTETESEINAAKPDLSPYATKAELDSHTTDMTNFILQETSAITAESLGLSNALHFIGVKTSLPAVGSNQDGDVILVGEKEYVYSNNSWVELGDASSYALKTIQVIAGTGLNGGGQLNQNITLNVNTNYTTNGKNYKVQTDTNNNLYVTVPWQDTDTHYESKNVFTSIEDGIENINGVNNGSLYLNNIENGQVTSSHKIVGTGATTIGTTTDGTVSIYSPVYGAGAGLSLTVGEDSIRTFTIKTPSNSGLKMAKSSNQLIGKYLTIDKDIVATKEDLESYALKTEIPSIAGLATESYVNEKTAAITTNSLGAAKASDLSDLQTSFNSLQDSLNLAAGTSNSFAVSDGYGNITWLEVPLAENTTY